MVGEQVAEVKAPDALTWQRGGEQSFSFGIFPVPFTSRVTHPSQPPQLRLQKG